MTEQPALRQPRSEVSSVRLSLVTSVRLLPHQAAVVPIQLPAEGSLEGPPLLLEPDSRGVYSWMMHVQPSKDAWPRSGGDLQPIKCSCIVEGGTELGDATSIYCCHLTWRGTAIQYHAW